jgi:hypothetical protein
MTSVVAWVPDPLRAFLDALRSDLLPGPALPTHLTLAAPGQFAPALGERIACLTRFEVRLGEIEWYGCSGIVAAPVTEGRRELDAVRMLLDAEAPAWPATPHLTLGMTAEGRAVDRARRRWEDRPRSSFFVENVSVVRNTGPWRWENLALYRLRGATLRRTA